jgi:hypothetical protein
MKTHILNVSFRHSFLIFSVLISTIFQLYSETNSPVSKKNFPENYTEYKGIVVDKKNGTPLAFANISIEGTNSSTVTNSDGMFLIKIPLDLTNPNIIVSFIGFKNRVISVNELKSTNLRIELESTSVQLPELSVISKDADALIKAVYEKKGQNYFKELTPMTAFYRETIKKNWSYVSLSEAVVQLNKQSYSSYKSDIAQLYKSRKKTDYTRLDTVTFKLQGGPLTSLYMDIMKNPDMIFTAEMFDKYDFTFDRSAYIDNRLMYVLDFKQKSFLSEPLYFGKLYIDAQNLALKSAVFKLNLTNREEASSMFIVKKPLTANVYPIEANYRVDYALKDGLWYYSYSRIEFGLRINWKRKLFNTTYYSTIEMAVTDWGKNSENIPISPKDRLRPSVIISDEASGFSDPEFWGQYNVIEPEKSIETAIKKIQKQLEKK